jgi:hypothetical protein
LRRGTRPRRSNRSSRFMIVRTRMSWSRLGSQLGRPMQVGVRWGLRGARMMGVSAILRRRVSVTRDLSARLMRRSEDPLHLALMRRCLELTLHCPVSPTAFCVGSLLYLPSGSQFFHALADRFPSFPPSSPSTSTSTSGLILSEGYSRQIPGNTHAEANALANFHTRYAELVASLGVDGLPPVGEILRQGEVECFATMEPCSIRTSGGPSCALELVRAGVKAVYLVSPLFK